MSSAVVTAVSRDSAHAFSKPPRESIWLIAGLGVRGDAHSGLTVRGELVDAAGHLRPREQLRPPGGTAGPGAEQRDLRFAAVIGGIQRGQVRDLQGHDEGADDRCCDTHAADARRPPSGRVLAGAWSAVIHRAARSADAKVTAPPAIGARQGTAP